MEDNQTLIRLGELIAEQRETRKSVDNLASAFSDQSVRLDRFERTAERLNEDVRAIREDMVTKPHLNQAGLDLDDHAEHKKDFQHLRKIRQASESRMTLRKAIIIGACTALGSVAIYGAAQSIGVEKPHPVKDISDE